jgi:alanine-glyoxylate transaminase / serine-glyoxylate transaminase / serine-pyruvate transaminase
MTAKNSPRQPGRHFLQIPGPTNVPDRILRAIDYPTIDHRGESFAELGQACLEGLKSIFQVENGQVFIYPASGTGAWEAALVNTLSPGDRVILFETGQFAVLWRKVAERFGLEVDFVPGDWRHGIDPNVVEEKLKADSEAKVKAVLCVHNETSGGITSRLAEIRRAIDSAGHPALLMADMVSSLASIECKTEEWGVDVAIASSQKGLMLPPGLSFNAVSAKALDASRSARLPRSFWAWDDMLNSNRNGYFPYTPATNLLYGLREALAMLEEEGLTNVFRRHARHAEATRSATKAWGLEIVASNEREYSNSLTAVLMPPGFDEALLRRTILSRFNLSLGAGLGKLASRAFRIGHLGDFNDLMLCATLAGVEMGLKLGGVPHQPGGIAAAMEVLSRSEASSPDVKLPGAPEKGTIRQRPTNAEIEPVLSTPK